MASFKAHCAFGFWKGDLLFRGNHSVQKKAAEAMGHFGRITTLADLPSKDTLLSYIKEAARLNGEGVKRPTKPKSNQKKPLEIPGYVTSALAANRRARETFEQFSDSHKREYVEWITDTKGEDTRNRRLETALRWMAEGKSRNWKYARC